jgi:hypothetical protein
MNSGCPGHAAPVTKFPSVKQRSIGLGSNHVAPAKTTLSFTAGYAVHFLPYCNTMNKQTSRYPIMKFKKWAHGHVCEIAIDNKKDQKHKYNVNSCSRGAPLISLMPYFFSLYWSSTNSRREMVKQEVSSTKTKALITSM